MGSYRKWLDPAVAALAALLAAGCGDGNSSGAAANLDSARNQSMAPAAQAPGGTAAAASVSGRITYDFVPAVASKDRQGQWLAKLDYAKTVQKPARNVVVELINDKTGKVVLSLLVGVDGRVSDSKIEKSSGSPRLDQAARQALSLCQFTPGSVDGKPEQAWGRLAYEFKDPNQ